MRRVILSAPNALVWEDLTDAQQQAITGVGGQFVMPIPGTRSHAGRKIIDALVADTFDPDAMRRLCLPFVLLGLWQWDGDALPELQPMDAAIADYLPDLAPTVLPHGWSGWPSAAV